MFFDGQNVNIFVAFLAGMVTFVAPCILPILPAYIGYISGVSLGAIEQSARNRRVVFFNSLAFVSGFLVVFVLLGITATWIGQWLNAYRHIIQVFDGVLFILVGLHLAGLFETKLFARYVKANIHRELTRFQYHNAFLIGMTFGFSWTPCIGPVLAVILFAASRAATFWNGFALLLAFGLGLGLPFLLLSLFAERLMRRLRAASVWLHRMQVAAGIIIVLLGVLLIGDWLAILVRPLASFGTLETWLMEK